MEGKWQQKKLQEGANAQVFYKSLDAYRRMLQPVFYFLEKHRSINSHHYAVSTYEV